MASGIYFVLITNAAGDERYFEKVVKG